MHFALHKLHMLPSVLNNLPREEKALVYASIITRLEVEKKEQDRINRMKAKRGSR